MPPRVKSPAFIIGAWIVALLIAASLDSTCAAWAHAHGTQQYLEAHKPVRELLKAPGNFLYTFPIVLLAMLHRARWRAAVLVAICDAIVACNDVIKWIVGRTRPYKLHDDFLEPFVFHPFRGGLPGMFKTSNLCFPSGHAALAFASAAALSILLPRWRWVFYAIAAIVAVERVLEDAHWLSDTVGAAALGIGGAWIVRRLWWDKQSPKLSHG